MKKFLLLSLLSVVSFSVFATDWNKFLGWTCTDKEAIEQELKQETDGFLRLCYLVMLGRLNDDESTNTYQDYYDLIKSETDVLNDVDIFNFISMFVLNTGYDDLIDELLLRPESDSSLYFKYYFLICRSLGELSNEEKLDILYDKMIQDIETGFFHDIPKISDEYSKLIINESEEVAIPKLKYIYRLLLINLDSHPELKPVIVKITLTLKGFGVAMD